MPISGACLTTMATRVGGTNVPDLAQHRWEKRSQDVRAHEQRSAYDRVRHD
jgi:hypothetical protein